MKKNRSTYLTKNKRGFTLIEIIVSIAILGIMIIAFSGMFGFGLNNIIASGKNSKADYNAQSIMENNLSDSSVTPSAVTRTAIDIKLYKSGTLFKTISGDKVEVDYNFGSSTKKLTTFTAD